MTQTPAEPLRLLLLADLHYVGAARHECPIPARHAPLGRELAERAIRKTLRSHRPDAVVLLGDIVDNGLAAGAEADLAALHDTLCQFDVPLLVVPGNHDGHAQRVFDIFRDHPGLHEIKGHRLVTIAEHYGEGDVTRHSEADLALVRRTAAAAPRAPLIVLQHNPIHPAIESSYPYNPANAQAIQACYAAAGVALSLSGHYHPGFPLERVDGVGYLTAPALCEEPFRFLEVVLRGTEATVTEAQLQMPGAPPLTDFHCHTHYAYCRDDIHAGGAIERARLLGLRRLFLTEHAGQLYLPQEEFWGGRFFHDPGLISRRRHTPACRMDAYLAEVLPLRDDFVRLGIEVDGDGRGGLTLLDEDREHFELLVGAVHWLPPPFDPQAASPAALRRHFMAATESLCRNGIRILAHPFRYFRRLGLDVPTDLCQPMVQLLAATGVAAEINFHTNSPDPRFVAACLEAGVPIALGTDAHALWETGDLSPHLDILRQAGCSSPQDLRRALLTR